MKDKILLAAKGAAMGVAEVIPGVSGGTIAFITGIYERMINCVKAFGPGLLPAFREGGVAGIWRHVDGAFLATLLAGMAGGIVVGVFGVSHLMETVPEVLWAFFFGLIIASAIFVGKQVPRWGAAEIAAVLVGAVVAFGITLISPAEGNGALWFVFLSGMIAISAMILPGISGSFILLLMGMYTLIIPTLKTALKTFDTGALLVMAVFGAGCVTGLMTFSRLLSWTFKHHRSPTLALLTGFMVGSLNKIWPWRQITACVDKETGEILSGGCDRLSETHKILQEANVMPHLYESLTGHDPLLLWAVPALLLGFGLVFLLERLDTKKA